MKLSQKLNLIIVLFTVVVTSVVSLIVTNISSSSYFAIEDDLFHSKLSSLTEVVKDEFYNMNFILTDWAIWDATYDFVEGKNPTYPDDNLQGDVFQDLNLDFIYILDNESNILYGNKFNRLTREKTPIDKKTLSLYIESLEDTGIVQIDDDLYLYAVKNITDNNLNKEPNGRMGFLRKMDENYLHRLELKTNLSLAYDYADQTDNTSNGIEPAYGIRTFIEHSLGEQSKISLHIPITHSSKNLVLYSKLENSIQILGSKYAKETLLILITTLIVLGIALDFAFRKFVLKRLLTLIDQVSWIRSKGKTEERLGDHGIDEIGVLGKNINAMLEELDRIHKEIQHYATFDEMTGVFNRRVGYDILEECIRNKVKNDIEFSIVYIDIDGLKKVNDNFGHKIGDALIEDVVQVIKSVQDHVHIVRLGGDEFLVILKNTVFEEAKKYETQLLDTAKKFNETSERIYTLSFSTGCTQYIDVTNIEELLEVADKKMYADKSQKTKT